MSPAEWAKLKEWFGAAMDADTVQLQRLLREAEAESPYLAAELRSLLIEHGSKLLHTRSLASPRVEARHDGPVGPYRILSELGRGGAGVVFLAERADDEFHRQVALKLLRYAAWDRRSEEFLTQERRALSQLQHPTIAALLDWGVTPDGAPWIAVEYVDGQPIDQYCRTHQLGLPRILGLFDQVCQAVQYAHRRLIVHRDLKPANILVTAAGLVKLLDFGIAKLLEQQADTATVERRFTPAYAAPEQIEGGAVTAATDVYALGLLLYELLTGSLPHAAETLRDMARRLEDRQLPPPSAASRLAPEDQRAIRGDLDRIVLHALERDPERRYPSVEALLADLGRYRAGYPIAARRPSAAYRAVKFARRNALPVAAIALAAAGLVTGTAVAVWKARAARLQQAAAERRFHELQSLAHSVIFDLHDAIRGVPGTVEARRLLVSTALKYLDGLNAEHIADDNLQMELASGYLRMAYVQGGAASINIGQSKGSEQSYRTALRIFDEQWRRHFDGERIGTLRFATAYNLALLLNNPADGATLAAPYTDEAEAWIGRNPHAPPMQAAGLLHRAMGRTLRAQGDLEGALYHLDRSIDLLRALLPKTNPDESTRPMFSTDISTGQGVHDTGISTYSRAAVLLDMGRPAEALAAAVESGRLFDRDAALAPPSPAVLRMLAVNHGMKAEILLDMGRLDEALTEARAELARAQSNAAGDGASATDHRDLAEALRRMGNILCARGDLKGGLAHLEDAAGAIGRTADLDPGFLYNRVLEAGTLNDYGRALQRAGRAGAAVPLFHLALDIAGRALAEAPSYAELFRERARACAGLGMRAQSLADWSEFRRRSPLNVRLLRGDGPRGPSQARRRRVLPRASFSSAPDA
jgi:tetratricopeptide (TPR) repeat protein